MQPVDRVLALVQEAFAALDDPSQSLSVAMGKAVRIARLRNDSDSLWRLEFELISFKDKEARARLAREMSPHYTASDFTYMRKRILEDYISRRQVGRINDEGILEESQDACVLSVKELEDSIVQFQAEADRAVPPTGMHPVDLYMTEQQYFKLRNRLTTVVNLYQTVLSRIRQEVHRTLSIAEHQLVYGQINSDIWERNRRYVDSRLQTIAPDVLEQFNSAYRRLSEGDREARSQALTSIRRLLKSLADAFYPPRSETVIGKDGKEHLLTEERYIARLWQLVYELSKWHSAGELLLAQVDDLGHRIDAMYDLTNKGVHADVSEFEVNQCAIQAYLTVGDILRLVDNDSGVLIAPEDADE